MAFLPSIWAWVLPVISSIDKPMIKLLHLNYLMPPEFIQYHFPQYSLQQIRAYCEDLKFADLHLLASAAVLQRPK
jgi:hypothetical protein